MPEIALFTKRFKFSASYEQGDKIFGHNYILSITVDDISQTQEQKLCDVVEKRILSKVHSRDMSLHVDFLRGVDITERNLLKEFYSQISPEINFCVIKEMSLDRDETTHLRMSF